MHSWDLIIIGAGAAGLFCAGQAAQRGLNVLLLDHAERVAEKIRISGGGRCNFTNTGTTHANFLSENPHFTRSALSRYTPQDFIDLLGRHGVTWHEKHKGQLFCDQGSEAIIDVLLAECETGGVTRWQPCKVADVAQGADGFTVQTDRGPQTCAQLVVATGGLSIPKIGATDWGQRLAVRLGHRLVPLRPALVPLTFDAPAWGPWADVAGVALPVEIAVGTGKKATRFHEDLLFTHRGLSGPAVLQISSYWTEGQALSINLAPGQDLSAGLVAQKTQSKRQLGNVLPQFVPERLAEKWLSQAPEGMAQRVMPDQRDRDLQQLAQSLQQWSLVPNGSEGYRKAEVTAGGVDTRDLSSQSMESRVVPGLYFIGEVMDVTGWLGGYNFQWAWASAAACAEAAAARHFGH